MKKILITGGAGFIGSHVARLFVNTYPSYEIFNLDVLTYAGNLENLKDLEDKPNYHFIKGDITDEDFIVDLFNEHDFAGVIHLAAESHVDRSIADPLAFVKTNVIGTLNLLNAAKNSWKDFSDRRFYHISTDEVYGTLGDEGSFTESTPYAPNSPYSASKAGSDMIVRSYYHTYGMNTVISNCSNNFGPHQHDEKLIPTVIRKALKNEEIPVYGTGENVRDWLFVRDHCKALMKIFEEGTAGEPYNIGGKNEWKNIDLVHLICDILNAEVADGPEGDYKNLITFVADRLGHDFRYSVDISKINTELGWTPSSDFKGELTETVRWYIRRYSGE